MPTRIVFAGGESIFVAEDVDDVVKGLEDISPNSADTVKLTPPGRPRRPGDGSTASPCTCARRTCCT